MRMSYKKMLPLIVVGLLLLSVLIVPSFAPPQQQPSIIDMLEKILSGVKDIRGWFDPQGGTYSKTPQIETGEGHVVFPKGSVGYYNISEAPADGRPAYKITITIFVENVGPDEKIYYAFHLGPTEGRREFSSPQILAGWPTTNEFCVYGEEPFQLWMPDPLIEGVEVWYNYVVMYEP